MIALILSLAIGMPLGPAESGTATWYGNTHPQGARACHGGFKYTCSPYSSGERVMYAAMKGFKNGKTKPYKVLVCRKKTTKCVVVTVRDCLCHGGNTLIDLSPVAFMQLGGLHLGRLNVTVREIKEMPWPRAR